MKENGKLEKFISKPNLKKALNQLLKDTHLVAPVNPALSATKRISAGRKGGVKAYGDIVFQEVEAVDDIVLDYMNCLNTPKDYTLLNDEVLFRYNLKKLKVMKSNYDFPKIVIFGSRACDTKAVGLLDKFFSKKFEDPLYFSKRNNLFIITLMCPKLGQNCFCTSTHSGPYLEDGFDVQLIDIGEGYFLEAESLKGKDFVKTFSHLITAVDSNKKSKKEDTVKKAVNSKDVYFNLKKVYDNLDRLNIKDELWEDLNQRCQSCGGCLLICPTCSCFYVVDKKINNKEGARLRSLDACFYEGLTKMSGGYNPISPREIMMRRKFYHKLWQQLDEFGESGCTGCGRCNEICPGNVNWLEVIKRIEKVSV